MRILRTLTLGYAGVLILALASSLIAIWRFLERIGATLAKVHDELERVQTSTEPLNDPIQGLHDVAQDAAGDLEQARDSLAEADRQLVAIVERRGVAQPAR